MNKKVIIILILTIIALAYLTYYSFGTAHIGVRPNPKSLKPTHTIVASENKETFAVYHNKDVSENYYTVSIPQSWQIQPASAQAGEYNFKFDNGTAKVDLVDVPDNTNLNLFILSQEEPRLKTSLAGYKKIDYKKITVRNYEAYQLSYLSNLKGLTFRHTKTYIAGPDHATVITFSLPQTLAESYKSKFNLILNSFSWE